jgi:asparagine synthase (glutamine-hydrolysing)
VSAIFGIIRETADFFDGAGLDEMSRCLSHRGQDRSGSWVQPGVELGHRLNGTAPEWKADVQPWPNDRSSLVITCDARLDDRDELCRLLEMNSNPRSEIPDCQLVLGAYQKWGEKCVDHLEGDFSFAIWDREKSLLFAARDRFGVKPFCYFTSESGFAFASEIKALLVSSSIPAEVDDRNIGRYLFDIPISADETFYKEIRRLPPGHWIRFRRGVSRVQRYWELRSVSEIKLSSDDAYAEALYWELSGAVRRRLRTKLPIGAMLSGGLDSSSIAYFAAEDAATRNERLQTFSNVFEKVPECDERPFIQEMIDSGGMIPHFCPGDASGPLSDLNAMLWSQDGPFSAPGLYLNCRLNAAAQKMGVRVMLDGHGGDETVSVGHLYPKELARKGSLIALWKECRGLALAYDDSACRLFRGYAGAFGPWAAVKKSFVVRETRRVFGATLRHTQRAGTKPIKWSAILNRDYCEHFSILKEYASHVAGHPLLCQTEREYQLKILKSPAQAAALETLDRSAAAFGIEPRLPFVDRRLMEFCLSLPASQKLHHGWSRVVMRRAMKRLPRKIAWRRKKADLSPNFRRGLQLFDGAILSGILREESSSASSYLNLPQLTEAYSRYQAEHSTTSWRDGLMMWKVAVVVRWLGQRQQRVVESSQAKGPEMPAFRRSQG